MVDIPQIVVAASDVRIGRKGSPEGLFDTLKVGQTIQGKVLQSFSRSRVQLLLMGKKITAHTHIPLETGERILLQVKSTGSQYVLKMIPFTAGDAVKADVEMLTLLGRNGPFEPILNLLDSFAAPSNSDSGKSSFHPPVAQLVGLLHRLAAKPDDVDPGKLKALVSRSGLAWENKLRYVVQSGLPVAEKKLRHMAEMDVKAMVMQLLKTLSKADMEQSGQLQRLLNNIEQFQLANRASADEAGRIFLPLPFLSEGLLKFGQLLVHRQPGHAQEEGRKDNGLVRVALLLEMTNLGDLLAEFSILQKGISGSFTVENQSVQQFVEVHLPELKGQLEKHGFEVQQITCRVMPPETLSQVSLFEDAFRKRDGFLNIVV